MYRTFMRGFPKAAPLYDATALLSPAAFAEEADGLDRFLESIELGALIEVEATTARDFAGDHSSDITLSTVEVSLDAQPHKYATAHILGLYEDDGSGNQDITLDEAFMIFADPDEGGFPLYLQAGKWVMPFGDFETSMSADPLTLELAETKEVAILVGAHYGPFTVEAYGFNGDTNKAGDDDVINHFGITAGFETEIEEIGIGLAGGYINNIADSDTLTDALGPMADMLQENIGGYEARLYLSCGPFGVFGGYMRAAEAFDVSELAFDGSGAKPGAWHVETAYTTALFDLETVLAVTWQGTQDALALDLPQHRVGGAITVAVLPYTAVTVEYLHDWDYGTSVGGTGNTGHTGTIKLALEFYGRVL